MLTSAKRISNLDVDKFCAGFILDTEMNDGRTCNNYCNFFFSCFSVTSNKLYFAWVYSNIVQNILIGTTTDYATTQSCKLSWV